MNNKIIVPFSDKGGGVYELNVDLDKLSKGEMLNAIVGIGRTSQQPTFVSKINKAKKPGEVPSSNRDVQINYGKGLDYIYGTKPLNDQAEYLNPFTSALKKIKPNASESEKLSWFKSSVVEAKSVNELHKAIDQVLASGGRLNACNVKTLQHLLTRSFSGKALAVKRVTENQGKNTAGVDRQLWSTCNAKFQGIKQLKQRGYKPSPLKRIYISKSNGKRRPLGIPTIKDRAMQALYLFALEPIAETISDRHSYGFRPKRSCADATVACHLLLASRNQLQWILEGDIKGCFDNINHEWLMKHIPMEKKILHSWLKAGFLESKTLYPTTAGTPQGGIISPIISNIFMHHVFDMWMRQNYPTMPFERYVDDAIVHCKTQKQAEFIKVMIGKRLAEYKLKLHPEKTQIVYCKDHYRKGEFPKQSFDFLGYTFRPRLAKNKVKGYRVLFMPAISNKAKKKIHQAIKSWKIHRQTSTTMEEISKKVNPIVRGWFQYYGRFYKSEMHPTLRNIERYLIKWARKKYKKLRAHGRLASQFLGKVRKRSPNIFYHWELGQGSKG